MSEKISELPSFSGGSLPSTAKIPVSIDGVTYKAQPSTFSGGGGSVGNLQQVTDNGKTTTNRIELQRLSDGEDVVILDNESDEVGHIQILDPDTGKKNIFDPNIIQMYKNGSISTTITNENITSDLELQIPNKSGVKVIATVDDISGKEDSLNKVTTFTGNTTSTTKFPVVKAIVDWVNSLGFITNVATALGYTPANKAGETFTGAITATNLSGTNTGDETITTIKSKLGITTLSGSNTGDQDLSGLVPKTTTVNSKALSSNITLTTADIADSTNKRYQTDNQNTYNDATSSIQTQLNGKLANTSSAILTALGWYNYKNTTPSSTLTGTLTETQLLQITIPANTFGANDFLKIPSLTLVKSGTNAGATIRVKLSTSNTMPSGATGQIATYSISATVLYSKISRIFSIASGNILGFNFLGTSISDNTTSTSTISSQAFDRTVTQYLYVSATLSNTSDSVYLNDIQVTNM